MNDVKLRDRRKPGHCWQDNELYDAFGPVIGPNAVLVYVQMTRNCYGTEIRSSSRELARDSRLSKDTVLRAMQAMERVGLLRAVGGGPRRVAEYHLADLKDLAVHHGASYDPKRASYVFSVEQTEKLRAVASGAVRDTSGAVGDRLEGPSVAVGDSAAPHLALQKPTSGAPEAQLSSYYSRKQEIQNNTPLPPSAEGGGGERDLAAEIECSSERYKAAVRERDLAKAGAIAAEIAALRKQQRARESSAKAAAAEPPAELETLAALARWVMASCGASEERRLRAVIENQMELAAQAQGESRRQVAARMVEAWRSYREQGPALRWTCGPPKFFRYYWAAPELWPIDSEAAERMARKGRGF